MGSFPLKVHFGQRNLHLCICIAVSDRKIRVYFDGQSGSRSVQEYFNLITFIQEAVDKYIPSKTNRSVASVLGLHLRLERIFEKGIKLMQSQKRLAVVNSDLSFRN